MRGELDDALARLRRWDAVRQRLAGESVETEPDVATQPGPVVPEAAPAPPPVPVAMPSSAPPAGQSAPLVPSPPGYLLPRAMGGDIITPQASTGSAGAGSGMSTMVSVGSTQTGQAGPAVAVAAAVDESETPQAVDDIVNAVAVAMRRHRTLAITLTIDDVNSSWTAQFVRGEDGQVVLSRLERYGIDANAAGQQA